VVDDDLSSYHESDDQLASLLSYPLPPLGTIRNRIIISNKKMISRVYSVAQVIMRCNQCLQPLLCTSFIVKTAPIVIIITLNVLSTSVTIAFSMLLGIKYLIVHFVEAGDFNSSGG
jgi:hypothetical protein